MLHIDFNLSVISTTKIVFFVCENAMTMALIFTQCQNNCGINHKMDVCCLKYAHLLTKLTHLGATALYVLKLARNLSHGLKIYNIRRNTPFNRHVSLFMTLKFVHFPYETEI